MASYVQYMVSKIITDNLLFSTQLLQQFTTFSAFLTAFCKSTFNVDPDQKQNEIMRLVVLKIKWF